jgi:hypothetical protein
VSNSTLNSGEALRDPVPKLAECSGQGGKDLQANIKCNEILELVDYKVDSYKEAPWMCDLSDGGGDIFFYL